MFDVASAEAARGSASSGGTEAEPASDATRRAKVRLEKLLFKRVSSMQENETFGGIGFCSL
jgi:hypothetical protein